MSDRTLFRRLTEKGTHDRQVVNGILDAALICHVGFIRDGYPVVLPTIHARVENTVYIHGSKGAGNLRALKDGAAVCLSVTVVDAIVAARSLFEHSMNYRSAVVFGSSRMVSEPAERTRALKAISDHVIPGRWDDARGPTPVEDRQTTIIAIEVQEASAKVSAGWPDDPAEDLGLDVWAGLIPLSNVYGEPIPDHRLQPGIEVPSYIRRLVGGGEGG